MMKREIQPKLWSAFREGKYKWQLYPEPLKSSSPENLQQTPKPLAQAEPRVPPRAEHSVAV